MPDTTILDVLTQEPPKIGLSLQNEGGNTENIGWVTIAPSDISTWKDFTYNNIAAAYGDLLGRQAPGDERRRPRAVDFTESQCLMVNESAVDYLCQTWCEGVIKKSMKECAAVLRERLDLHPAEPSFKSHARTLSSLPNEGNPKKMFLPDWFIHVHPRLIILPPAGTNHNLLTNPNSSQRNSPVPIPPPEGYSRNLRKQPTDLPPPLITTNLEPDSVPFARLSPSRRTARARSPLSKVRNADETDTQFKDTDVFSRTMRRLATPGATSPRRAEQESTTPGAKKWVVRGLLGPTPSPRPSISPRASPGPEVRNESAWMTPSTTPSRPSDSVLGKRKSAALPTPSIERDNPFTIPRPRNPSPYSIRGDGYGVDERGRNADGSPSVRERTKRRQMEGGR